MTAPTTHWSTTGQLHTGTVAGCEACEGVGTGAGEGATGQDTGTAWVTRSADCPEAPAQAHPLAGKARETREEDAGRDLRTGQLHTGPVEGCGECGDRPVLVCKPLAQIVTFWRPGSHEWTWAEEYADLVDDPVTERVDARVRREGIDFADEYAPVLLGSDGRVWDGHHRICLAIRYSIHSLMCEIAGPTGESFPRSDEPCQNRRESDSLPPRSDAGPESVSLGRRDDDDAAQVAPTRTEVIASNLRVLRHETDCDPRGHDADGACCRRAERGEP